MCYICIMDKLRIGILRETKNPPDKRVALTPTQCRDLLDLYADLQIVVQPSDKRCYSNDEYEAKGITLSEDLSACQVLMGVKEVKIDALIEGLTYLFFSHTAKKQPYNRGLLNAVVDKDIRLVDYEYLTNQTGIRVVAFGRWAGVVGAYNGLRALGIRSGNFNLKPAYDCYDLEEVRLELKKVEPGKVRIALTGGGRVAGGAVEVLEMAEIPSASPADFLESDFEQAVYTRLDPWHYAVREDGTEFDFNDFMAHPRMYENNFLPFAKRTDLFIACHFWDPNSPVLLSREDLLKNEVPVSIVADISCDIAGPIASTLRASSIQDPFYGYCPETGEESEPFEEDSVTVMAVDNLPGELPRDASADFGAALMEHVIPELLGKKDTGMINRASIAAEGALTEIYAYLQNYLEGKE
jgi:saccharopine dehydrogenase (NAD+, L-lysine-forming)